jgi:poly-gamma-glutamate capsule biosynthesis protein CapA/YwtB (metallophosphatase superfamily)
VHVLSMHILKRGDMRKKSISFILIASLIFTVMFFTSSGENAARERFPGTGKMMKSGSGDSKTLAEKITDSGTPKSISKTSKTRKAAGTDSEQSVTILGAGDNLIHDYLYNSYTTEYGYDFSPCYEDAVPTIKASDIAVINSETPMASEIYKPSSWPCFNTPTEDADALKSAGFDVINQGNNHTFDKGIKGVEATLKCWSERGLPVTGVYSGDTDMHTMRIIEKNGIKVAFLGFVELSNSKIPDNSPYQMVFIQDKDKVEGLIKEAKAASDVVVVSVHWGTEDQETITSDQREMAQEMVDWGADVIFGTHPHVLQELSVLKRESDGALCPVAYSLGNFVSAQHKKPQLIGGMLTVKAVKNNADQTVKMDSMCFTPTVTHFTGNRANSKIYLEKDYTDALAAESGVNNFDHGFSTDYIKNRINESIPYQYQNRFAVISK